MAVMLRRIAFKVTGAGRQPAFSCDKGCDKHRSMEELMRTNDFVLITLVESLLKEAGIFHTVADRNMSLVEGSIGAIPSRVLVESDQLERARQIMRDVDLGAELSTDRPSVG